MARGRLRAALLLAVSFEQQVDEGLGALQCGPASWGALVLLPRLLLLLVL